MRWSHASRRLTGLNPLRARVPGLLSSNETPSVTVAKHLLVFIEQEKGLAMSRTSFTSLMEERNQLLQGGKIPRPTTPYEGFDPQMLLSKIRRRAMLSRIKMMAVS